ncbi:MAG: CPBP family intramembrane glutamic endopeptidase [Planctomycetota bacterium]
MSQSPARQTDHATSPLYWDATRGPLQSLVFLLPVLIAYEGGTLAYRAAVGELPVIKAQSWLAWVFEFFGASTGGGASGGASGGALVAWLLPPVVIVVVLLSMHFAEGGKAKVRPRLWVGMWAESLVLAAPLLVFSAVMFRASGAEAVLQGTVGSGGVGSGAQWGWMGDLLLSLGAGLYEELVFRLIAIAAVHAVLVNALRLDAAWGAAGAIALSAVAFGLYHFDGASPFDWGLFTFYVVAGVYLAGVYLLRGFGIAVACHAVYDVVVVTLAWWQGGGG